MWDVLFSCLLCLIEPNWYWQLTQIITGVLELFRFWLTSPNTPCLPVFSALFVSCMFLKFLSLPSSFLFVVCPQHRYLLLFFEPIPSSLCVRVDVEMTSVVELFSDRFSFSVKSGMWTDQCCPFQSRCMCCMCAANHHHSPGLKSKPPNEILLPSYHLTQNQTSLGRYGLTDTCIFLNNSHLSAVTRVTRWFMSFWESIDYFVSR